MSENITLVMNNRGFYIVGNNRQYYTYNDILQHIRDFDNISLTKCDEYKELVSMLKNKELNKEYHRKIDRCIKGDTNFLNRIIRNGGFIEYIMKMEEV